MRLKLSTTLAANRRLFALSGVAALLTLSLAGCGSMAAKPAPKTLADTLAADASLSTLSKLVTQAGLSDTLKSTGPFTVFAPSNEAFSAVPAKTMAELASDPARLKAVLAYHVIAGKVMAADVQQGPAKSVQGANLALSKAGNFVTVEDAMVTKADIAASNGVVHMIDRVLIPPATPK
jgi:uncharacterized surface protein with fasciclin (FAS1) repeats